MKALVAIWSIIVIFALTPSLSIAKEGDRTISIDFYGDTVNLPFGEKLNVSHGEVPTKQSIQAFYDNMVGADYKPVIDSLLAFKTEHNLNDWFYYQLIRKTAQAVSPKEDNYTRYTLYKWFLLTKSGYDANLGISKEKIIFYVRNEEDIYDIPYYLRDGKHYVCLNIHDYNKRSLNFEKNGIYPVDIVVPEGQKAFSYKVTHMPNFSTGYYAEKNIKFNYGHKVYEFNIKVNPQVQTIFANYPVVNFESYFNIPLSAETYNTLIPELRKNVEELDQKQGVDYLMEFTRQAFKYKDDKENFGKEKRLSPEQTLLNKYSDCDDRAAFFFYLVKEIYDLPMIALLYPTHITVAVHFDGASEANTILYKGKPYTICEPTNPMLAMGEVAPEFREVKYEIAYAYDPGK